MNAPHVATTNLWCISKSSHHLVTSISSSSSQHLTMLLSNPISGFSTLIIGVFCSNNPTHRKDLWTVLINTSLTTLPWCVLGDFNAILAHDEKLSLRQAPPRVPINNYATRPFRHPLHWQQNHMVK
ncbi:hypothetical protein AAC387_Pa04g1677 [Persea americana]